MRRAEKRELEAAARKSRIIEIQQEVALGVRKRRKLECPPLIIAPTRRKFLKEGKGTDADPVKYHQFSYSDDDDWSPISDPGSGSEAVSGSPKGSEM